MLKGWLYVENKTNAEREEEEEEEEEAETRSRRHILAVERREKNFDTLLPV
jgi:hypothetical protein